MLSTRWEEVREAMRLDIPSPLGARILLIDDSPSFLISPISSSMSFCWRVEVQEEEAAGRPTVEYWPGRTKETEDESGETEGRETPLVKLTDTLID